MNKTKISIILGIAIIAIVSVLSFSGKLLGVNNPSTYTAKTTATATTTPSYMTPGTATTTLTISQEKGGFPSLAVAFTASSSAAILNWNYQFSRDGVDWYEEDAFAPTLIGTTDAYDHASTTVTHRWTPGSTTASTSRKVLNIPETSANFARVKFSLPIGTVNGAVYAEIIR